MADNPESKIPKEYLELVAYWKKQEYVPLPVDCWNYMQFNPALTNFLAHAPVISWILDLRSQAFDLISHHTEDLLGYEVALFKEKGLAFCNEIKHPEDLSRTWKLLKQVWEVLARLPIADRSKFKFNHDYRIVKPDGQVVRILEQSAVLQQDRNGNVTRLVGMYTDITNWKKSEEQVASVTCSTGTTLFLVCEENECVTKPGAVLSKREVEIVRLLAQGYSSKQVAGILGISLHTVSTHRQNMMEKTGCKNMTELMPWSFKGGIL